MSKLKCICGHHIIDQTDNISYKGYILPDTHLDDVSTFLTTSIDSLINALELNNRISWINTNLGNSYPTNVKNSSMIHDLLGRKLINTTQDIFECENCGRIAIQIQQTNEFKFFSPDTNDTTGIIRGKK